MLTISAFYEESSGWDSNEVRGQCTEQGWLETPGVKEVKDAGSYLCLSPAMMAVAQWTERTV